MKKKITIGAIVALIVIVIAFFGIRNQMSKTDDENVIKIGVILPLTGALSQEGKNCQAAVELAAKEINEKGNNLFKVKLLIEDSKFTSKDSLQAFNKIMLEKVDAFVVFGTPPTQAIKERINSSSLPLLAIDGTSGLAKSSQWIFECFPAFTKTGANAGKLTQEMDCTNRVGVLTINSSGGDDFFKGFIQEMDSKTKIIHEKYDANAQNIRPQIAKLLSINPEAICIFGFGVGYITAINQILELGYKGEIITDSNLTSIIDKLKDKDKAIYFVSHNFGAYKSNIKSQNFINEMRRNINIKPTSFAAHFYDMVKMISDAAIQENSTTPSHIKDGLLNMKKHKSLFGEISFDPHGNLEIPQIIVKWQNGTFELIETK